MLAIGGTAAAIAVLMLGRKLPPPSFTLPWAVIPIPGLLLAFWLAERYRDRFGYQPGWRGYASTFLDSIHLIRQLFVRPQRWWPALAGMALFWAADAFAAWAGLAAFGFQMDVAALYIGFATGMLFTRRTGPLAGAGLLAPGPPGHHLPFSSPFAVRHRRRLRLPDPRAAAAPCRRRSPPCPRCAGWASVARRAWTTVAARPPARSCAAGPDRA